MEQISRINEQQYRNMFLNEEMHYPSFLDAIKEKVAVDVGKKVRSMIDNGVDEDDVSVELDCNYANRVLVHIIIEYGKDITDSRLSHAKYYNASDILVGGKLYNPTINIICPVNENAYNWFLLRYKLSHELTHMYDDWNSIRGGNGGINRNMKNIGTTNFVRQAVKTTDVLLRGIAFLAYMSIKTEKQAFHSQAVQELESVGCDFRNYKEKLRDTDIYRNITKAHTSADAEIKKATADTLAYLNTYITDVYHDTPVPRLNNGDFDAERYRTMLLKWSEHIYRDTLKAYGSVVQYYIDNDRDKRLAHSDILTWVD